MHLDYAISPIFPCSYRPFQTLPIVLGTKTESVVHSIVHVSCVAQILHQKLSYESKTHSIRHLSAVSLSPLRKYAPTVYTSLPSEHCFVNLFPEFLPNFELRKITKTHTLNHFLNYFCAFDYSKFHHFTSFYFLSSLLLF